MFGPPSSNACVRRCTRVALGPGRTSCICPAEICAFPAQTRALCAAMTEHGIAERLSQAPKPSRVSCWSYDRESEPTGTMRCRRRRARGRRASDLKSSLFAGPLALPLFRPNAKSEQEGRGVHFSAPLCFQCRQSVFSVVSPSPSGLGVATWARCSRRCQLGPRPRPRRCQSPRR